MDRKQSSPVDSLVDTDSILQLLEIELSELARDTAVAAAALRSADGRTLYPASAVTDWINTRCR